MIDSEEKKKWMQLALKEAEQAAAQGEVPIGAVIINEKGEEIARAYNRRELDQDATCHAEMVAIRQACRKLGSWRLNNCSLFVTLEPCSMCAGAIINARLKNVFIGAMDPKAGAAGSVVDLFAVDKFNHHPRVIRGLYCEQASRLLKNFFRRIRQKQKLAKKQHESGKKE